MEISKIYIQLYPLHKLARHQKPLITQSEAITGPDAAVSSPQGELCPSSPTDRSMTGFGDINHASGNSSIECLR
jgi:hypothetical protein